MRHPPSYLSKLGGGEGGWGVPLGGGRLEGVGGGGFPRWGGLRATHYYHMHTSRGDVCLGIGVCDICIAPRLANLALKSTDGLMKTWHTLKKGGAVGAMPPTHYLSKPGGLGGVAYKDRAQPPPWGRCLAIEQWKVQQ